MRRVVITGIGVISPIGTGVEALWSGLLEGRSGIGPVQAFNTSAFPVHCGGEVRDFQPEEHLTRQAPQSMGRCAQMAAAAAKMAVSDADLTLTDAERLTTGVCLGTTTGEPLEVERYNDHRKADDGEPVAPSVFANDPCAVVPGRVAREIEVFGPCSMIPTACAAGNYAIGNAADLIRAGSASVMLAGGADPFSRITYTGFARLGAIAPERCQPFDKNRLGMIPGEGAAVLVLEDAERARSRGARIYAEVAGCGLSCDAHHMTAGHPEGDGAVRAMAAALKESRINLDAVHYVCAHGTGTPTNDRVETVAMKALFGEQAYKIPMSSIKSMLGHTMGAASAIEAAACALALHTGVIPPTMNYEEPDPECDLDYVPNQARETHPSTVLNNAYAFGGNNACLCLTRMQ
ncbi:MAG: beta-ketoacyl-[acyl-carrier-protein] synthase family protein [Bryobacterales bacterium]